MMGMMIMMMTTTTTTTTTNSRNEWRVRLSPHLGRCIFVPLKIGHFFFQDAQIAKMLDVTLIRQSLCQLELVLQRLRL